MHFDRQLRNNRSVRRAGLEREKTQRQVWPELKHACCAPHNHRPGTARMRDVRFQVSAPKHQTLSSIPLCWTESTLLIRTVSIKLNGIDALSWAKNASERAILSGIAAFMQSARLRKKSVRAPSLAVSFKSMPTAVHPRHVPRQMERISPPPWSVRATLSHVASATWRRKSRLASRAKGCGPGHSRRRGSGARSNPILRRIGFATTSIAFTSPELPRVVDLSRPRRTVRGCAS